MTKGTFVGLILIVGFGLVVILSSCNSGQRRVQTIVPAEGPWPAASVGPAVPVVPTASVGPAVPVVPAVTVGAARRREAGPAAASIRLVTLARRQTQHQRQKAWARRWLHLDQGPNRSHLSTRGVCMAQ